MFCRKTQDRGKLIEKQAQRFGHAPEIGAEIRQAFIANISASGGAARAASNPDIWFDGALSNIVALLTDKPRQDAYAVVAKPDQRERT